MGACGSCGGRARRNVSYEVTFRDGSKETFPDVVTARLAVERDTSVGSRSATVRPVPKTTS